MNISTHELFIGTWTLVSSEFRTTEDGEVAYPLGENAKGLLTYDRCGYMSAHLMRSDRSVFNSDEHLKGTPQEIREAFEGYTAYYGKYKVDNVKGIVTHYVEGSLLPNWIGSEQERFFEINERNLTLKTHPMKLGKNDMVGVLLWERIV
ncbi:MAG: lipocalin-like domain-containing protein [Desulfobacterales bacterium]|jgi:hypothetical protein|nr:lipocalin-like domain-containing protein [Desulfobacteraceae bacterium]MBT4363033.1 lipocalin-like domain-containing protein [Desulfobacteraceae bacterium]MBT7084588.1 lipocalin-like domain-containing protein [Desulfobacterales bacterium]MBT7697658.1 lipocalin-like domain-containing protein [Desulfobacterales bacterium]